MIAPDWVDTYIRNEGFDSKNHAFGFTSNKIEYTIAEDLINLLGEVIRKCSSKEKELNSNNFKRLKITVVNEYCFNTVKRLETKIDSKYEYIILFPQDCITEKNTQLVKHKIAHEIAHFLFALKGTKFNSEAGEQMECNKKATDWGFPEPKIQ